MLAVLIVLAVLSAVAAAFFVQASDAVSFQGVSVARLVAENRAETGLQEAIRALRSGQLDLSIVTGPCTDAEVDSLTCPALFTSPMVDNGSAQELNQGGGLQYQYFIYRRVNPGDIGVPPNRYVVRSVGYSGYTLTSVNMVNSMVEAEVDVGNDNAFHCVGGYECQN
jgi:type II secretory pathway pseudopilin PulG